MNTQIQKVMIEEIGASIEIPDTAYEAAKRRYDDLSEWLVKSQKSKSAQCKPHVFPQGSFRYGTAIRPLGREDYDLDLCCNFQTGITKENCSQERLKELLGDDIEAYRIERDIKEKLERKHRCWRLNYQDMLKFHIDTVPCIPEKEEGRRILQERMVKTGMLESLAQRVAKFAVSITDDRKQSYKIISPDWNVSNPEGYAQWFENQMRQAKKFLEKRAIFEDVGRVDDLPTYKWRTPLQRCIQILKKHRDIMFKHNSDAKPISIIITTLTALAYQGEDDLGISMQNILTRIGNLVHSETPRVPNPINPIEDFADEWSTEDGRKLQLEENFWLWVTQVKEDFGILGSSDNIEYLSEQSNKRFGVELNSKEVQKKLGVAVSIPVGKGLAEKTPKKPVDYRGGGRFG